MKSIIKISNISVIIAYLLGYLKNSSASIFIPMTINLVLLVIYFLRKKSITFNKKIIFLVFVMLLIFVIYPLITINNNFLYDIESEILKNIIFIIDIFFISIFLISEGEEFKYIKGLYICIGIFIGICYFINFDNFEVFNKFKYVLNNSLRYRNDFGIYHFNATAQLCMIVLMLSFALRKINNNKLKVYKVILNIISIIVLLSTGSRNSIFSFIIFLIIYYFLTFKDVMIKMLHNKYVNLLFWLFIYLIIIFIVIFIYIKISDGNINVAELMQNTNRIGNFTNINFLKSNNRFMIGLGLINPSTFIKIGTNVDNWYLYMFLTEGILGMILMFIFIIYIIINIIFDKVYTKIGILMKCLLISQLFYAFFETSFYYPQMISSYIFWILIYIYILKSKIIKLNINIK